MVDKNSAPSYSIGGVKKSSLITDNGLPGPGAYNTNGYLKTDKSLNKYNYCHADYHKASASLITQHWFQDLEHIPSTIL